MSRRAIARYSQHEAYALAGKALRPVVASLALIVIASPLAAAFDLPQLAMGFGEAAITIGQGCQDADECHPEEYAWVLAKACLASKEGVALEAERLVEAAPLVVVPMEVRATGDPDCPFLAAGFAEFWMGLADAPLDCLRGTVVAASVVHTRVACFSDL